MGKKKKQILSCLLAFFCFSGLVLPAEASDGTVKTVIPLGNAVGIDLTLQGVTVTELATFHQAGKTVAPAKEAGLRAGDVLLAIAGEEISSMDDVKRISKTFDGSPVSIEYCRSHQKKTVSVTPFLSEEGRYELGIWMRDGITGIGTLTFYDPESGTFGALGHPVCDESETKAVEIQEGSLLKAQVAGVEKGQEGQPGQLNGYFDGNTVLGTVEQNTPGGLFGSLLSEKLKKESAAVPVAEEDEIHLGKATVLSNVRGETVEAYDVEITRIYAGSSKDLRSFMIKVTDENLLQETGGIVQGMSGSPILQDGKIVGAVTHVLIHDPTRGYGISMEKMLQAETASGETEKAAA